MPLRGLINELAGKAKRRLRHFAPLLFIATLAAIVFGVSQVTIDHRLRERNALLRGELGAVERREARLRVEVDRLRSEIVRLREVPQENLYQARFDLGMVGPGEFIYQFSDEGAKPKNYPIGRRP